MNDSEAVLRQKYVSQRNFPAAGADIDAIVSANPDVLEVKSFDEPFDRSDPYARAGHDQYRLFRTQAESMGLELPWGDVENGFATIGIGIAKCVYAYARYLRESGADFDQQQLTDALHNPRTMRFFIELCAMSEPENREYETYFCIRGPYANSDHGEFNFDIASTSFQPNPALEAEASEEAAGKVYELEKAGIQKNELGICEAYRHIPRFWRATVQSCLETKLLDEEAVTCSSTGYRTY